MRQALSLLLNNVPSLAFLAASLWCLHTGHNGFAVTCLIFSVCFHNYIDNE